MRCELCNRAETEVFFDGEGSSHNYCIHCIDEINSTLESYDEEEDTWAFWETPETDDPEEESSEDEARIPVCEDD